MFGKQQTNQLARLQFRLRALLFEHFHGTFRAVPCYDAWRRGAGSPPAGASADFGASGCREASFSIVAIAILNLDQAMNTVIGILITFLVVILVLYLVNMLPIDGRAKQIVRVIVIILGIVSLLKYIAVF
jgi:hypothetical protein